MLNINTQPLKTIRRDVSTLIRSGKTVSERDQAAYDRAVRALDYLSYRSQRGTVINGWWDLPAAQAMWEADVREINA